MIYVIYGLIAVATVLFFTLEVRGLVKEIKNKKKKKEELLNSDKNKE